MIHSDIRAPLPEVPPSPHWRGTIPVILNNRDRLTTTRGMAEYFDDVPGVQVLIVDNASTYPPLLDWYASCRYPVLRMPRNMGQHAPWDSGAVLNAAAHLDRWGSDWYVTSDSDLDLSGVPKDVIQRLMVGYDRVPDAVKIGLSLEINDIPECHRPYVIDVWERHYWADPLDDQFYRALIGHTFALYRRTTPHHKAMNYDRPQLRANRPYTARHVPWYLTADNIDAENRYYFDHADPQFSTFRKDRVFHAA